MTEENALLILRKKNLTASLGNVLEWYDFCLYGYFSPLLAKAFFPSHDKYLSLLYVFLTFASGYVVRPIGGIMFGHLGDSIGRGRALYYSICLISVPTFIIGLLPDYHSMGILSPMLLVFIRLLQGLSAGGQYSGTLIFLRQNNPPTQGARAVSMAYLGSLSGYLLASCVGSISTYFLNDQLAWRIPFLFTLGFILVLQYCRTELEDSSQSNRSLSKVPIITLFSQYKQVTIKAILLACVGGIYNSSFFVFLISYLNVYAGLKVHSVLWVNTLCLISSGILIIYFARIADRYGRRPVLFMSSLSLLLLIYPAFALLNQGDFLSCLLGMWLLTTANTAFMAACAVVYVELFPRAVQYTGCAISYNIGAGIVGGFVPFFLTLLMQHFDVWIMSGFLVGSAVFAVLFVYFAIPETLDSSDELLKEAQYETSY
jgi:MFS transporter, MHS family, proline/betaine transporter